MLCSVLIHVRTIFDYVGLSRSKNTANFKNCTSTLLGLAQGWTICGTGYLEGSGDLVAGSSLYDGDVAVITWLLGATSVLTKSS